MKKIHLIMPMGGAGSRFSKDGYELPKPLLEIEGKPFLFWATQSIVKFMPVEDITFVVLQEHIDRFRIGEEIRRRYPQAKIRVLDHVLNGAVLTCMEGVKEIHDDLPIIFNDCDHAFRCEAFYDFCRKGDFSEPDGALLTFRSRDPKFSFLELDASGNVTRTVEKEAVSEHAICGAYYFRNAEMFLNAAKKYLENCAYKEFFLSGVYNVMASEGASIRNFETDMHLPFGTPEEYDEAKSSPEFEAFV